MLDKNLSPSVWSINLILDSKQIFILQLNIFEESTLSLL